MSKSQKGDDADPATEDIKYSIDAAIHVHTGFLLEDKEDEQNDSSGQSVPGLFVDGMSEASIGKQDEAVDEVDQVEQSEEVVVVVRTGYSHQGNRQQEDHSRSLAPMSEPRDDAHASGFVQEDEERQRD